ncbi:MAG: 16S rRNA (adenine(1518)-N(6)/adenine(1519)-N(6))-dimethyltransferase RsmA [Candidatus Endonucleobacter sp. (ex Gigantidas childressi)]|nr:16S rRNA (adenine(1518)-N(6)/adenine(1519)-N(6))-dimethyltransferase RsmA [Candidatus Endonucleobacter sp. (ex Gigantidas childressi)]
MPYSRTTFHKPRKRFGQNFLHDQIVIHRIIRSVNPREGDRVIEIGPGHGALTEGLLDGAKALDIIEIDRNLIPELTLRFGLNPRVRIYEADALKFDFCSLKTDARLLRLVGNLPYNISTPLIFHLLSFNELIRDMHFMLQHEVVQRLVATPGGKNYGRLSIMTQYYCSAEYLFTVGPESFKPAPKVKSAIVRLMPHVTLPYPCKNISTLEMVVRDAFGQRRKTLANSLKNYLRADDFQELGIDASDRPERLHLADFVKITDYLEHNSSQDKK